MCWYFIIGGLFIFLAITIYLDNKKFNKHLSELRDNLNENKEYYSIIYNKDGSILYYEFNSRQGMYKQNMNSKLINKACYVRDEDLWFYINENNTFIHLNKNCINEYVLKS